jgi:hypothetical protein
MTEGVGPEFISQYHKKKKFCFNCILEKNSIILTKTVQKI